MKFSIGDWIKLIALVMIPTSAAGASWLSMREQVNLLRETRPTVEQVDKQVEKSTDNAMALVNQSFVHAAEQIADMREVQKAIQSHQLKTMKDVAHMAGVMDQIGRDVKSLK